jgi:hypothetical protein
VLGDRPDHVAEYGQVRADDQGAGPVEQGGIEVFLFSRMNGDMAVRSITASIALMARAHRAICSVMGRADRGLLPVSKLASFASSTSGPVGRS